MTDTVHDPLVGAIHVIDQIDALMPELAALVAAIAPKASTSVMLLTRLAPIIAQLMLRERQIRAGLSPELMEQIAADNRAADAGLLGN